MWGAIGTAVGGLIDYRKEKRQRKQYEEDRQSEWDREDSRLQRLVEDANAAGFSPLAALGSPAAGAIGTPLNAPHQGSNYADTLGRLGKSFAGRELQKLQLEGAQLNNDLVKAQIQNINADTLQATSRTTAPTQAKTAEADAVMNNPSWDCRTMPTGRTRCVPIGPDIDTMLTGTGIAGFDIVAAWLMKVAQQRAAQTRPELFSGALNPQWKSPMLRGK